MNGQPRCPSGFPTGIDLLRNPHLNKGTAFTSEERDALGLRGLLPPRVAAVEEQLSRTHAALRSKPDPLEKYIYLAALQDRNETLFFKLVMAHLEEVMPIIYTPVVGEACQKYGDIFRRPRGLYVSAEDRGRIASVLRNWPEQDVGIMVVTDGGRILGLRDLGANGMGIPVGKLNLYTACAGIPPQACLPVTLDVGTDNGALLSNPLYLGLRRPRLRGAEYDALLEEFVTAVREVFPGVLIQFEDFSNRDAFRLLRRYRDRVPCFNDDIQGTAAVSLAGLYAAHEMTGTELTGERLLFVGAGEAGIGIGWLVVAAMVEAGMDEAAARKHCWFVDSRGLVVAGREDLAEHKLPFAHEHEAIETLEQAVRALRPTALIGVSGQPQVFTQEVLEEMARHNERPIVFALSNPTSKAECTAEQAYVWTQGRAIFASGSPFPAVEVLGQRLVPGQCNNAYIFPGMGLGALCCGATRIVDEMFAAAAKALAKQVRPEDFAEGKIFPALGRIREVSVEIAVAVAEVAYERGLASVPRPPDLTATMQRAMYRAIYPEESDN